MDCWHRGIEKSGTEAEVVEGARDFLTLWSPAELQPVTQGWRDLNIESADDIERMKRWLVDEFDAEYSAAPGAHELRELGSYLWHASARISELRDPRR
jgi:hypothetical protein